MSVKCYTTNTLSEFVMQICEIRNQLDKKDNEVLLFRGQEDESYELIPSLARTTLDGNLINEERNLIELSCLRLPDIFKATMRPLERLALLQHYGIPTRLLDVTESAMVALYFACCSNTSASGEVIVFKNNDLNVTTSPVTDAICDSYRFATPGTFLYDFYDNIIRQSYYSEYQQLHKSFIESNDRKNAWVKQFSEKPIFTYAPVHSLRQQAQCGGYLLFANDYNPISRSESFFTASIAPLQKDDPSMIMARIKIPHNVKQSLLNDLKLFGISNSALFCDSIENICAEIKMSCQFKSAQRCK